MSAVPLNPYLGISFPWEKTEDVTIMGGHAHFLQSSMTEFESENDESEGHGSGMYGELAASRSSGTFSAPLSRSVGPSSTVGSMQEYSPLPEETHFASQPVQQQDINLVQPTQQHAQPTEDLSEWTHDTIQPTENATKETLPVENASSAEAAYPDQASSIEKNEATQSTEKTTAQKAFVEHAPTDRAPTEASFPQETTMGFDDFERALLREHMEPQSSLRATKVTRITSNTPALEGERRSTEQPAHALDGQQGETMGDDPASNMSKESTHNHKQDGQAANCFGEETAHGATEQVPVNVQDESKSVYSPGARSPEGEDFEKSSSPVDFSCVPEMRTTHHSMYSFNPHEKTALENSNQMSKELDADKAQVENSYDGLGISGTSHVGTQPEHEQAKPVSHPAGIEETPPIRPKAQRTTAPQMPATSAIPQHASTEDMNRTLKNKASRFFKSVWSGNKSKRLLDTPKSEPIHDPSNKQRWNIRDRLRPRNVRGHACLTTETDMTSSHFDSGERPTAPMRRMNRDVPSAYYSPAVSSHPTPGRHSQSQSQSPLKETQDSKTPLGFLFKKRASDVDPVRPSLSHKASNGILPMRRVNEEPTPVETEIRRNESMMRSRRRTHSISNMTPVRENMQERNEKGFNNQSGLSPVTHTNEPGQHTMPHSTADDAQIHEANHDAATLEPVVNPSSEAPVTESVPAQQSPASRTDEEKLMQNHNTVNSIVDAPSSLPPLSAEEKRLSLGLDEDSWALDLNFDTQLNTSSAATSSPISVQNNPFLAQP